MKINLNRRKFLVYAGATLGTSLLLKACADNPNSTTTTTETSTPIATGKSPELKIAIVLPGVITD